MTTFDNPPTLTEADELPLPEPLAMPYWTENFCNQAYFPDTGIGLWLHLSRLTGHQNLWRDTLMAYLPGDRFLLAKGHRSVRIDRGVAGSMLGFKCAEPFRRCTWRFDGAVRDVTGTELRAGALPDGAAVPMAMEITFEATGPVWDLGPEMRTQTWTHFHYEQPCSVTGSLELDGERLPLTGPGFRDHSRGPRELGSVLGHNWFHGEFPSGRSFAVLDVAPRDPNGHHLRRGYVGIDGQVHEAEVLDVELLHDAEQGYLNHGFRLRTDEGEHVIEGELLQTMPLGMATPNDFVFGAARGGAVTHALFESQTRYSLDGEVGYGLTERTVLVQ